MNELILILKLLALQAAIKQRAEWVKKASEELQAVSEKLEQYNTSFVKKGKRRE